MSKGLSYRDAGVDIEAGDALVEAIKPFARRTLRPEVLAGIGGFGALCQIPKRYRQRVPGSGADAVGSKLKLAFALRRHDTVGIELVAMSVNDILACGAEPLFFLDYYVCEKLDVRVATQVVKGIAAGCELAGCALIGGETAEHPNAFPKDEYDLAGFALGVVEKDRIVDGRSIRPGDVILGLAASGPHSNGYSLIRKILERARPPRGVDLLEPTRIYVKPVLRLLDSVPVKGLAHITGGGLVGNVPRILPEKTRAVIDRASWPRPAVFDWLQQEGKVAEAEMHRVFNCGIGMAVVVAAEHADAAVRGLSGAGGPRRAGGVCAGRRGGFRRASSARARAREHTQVHSRRHAVRVRRVLDRGRSGRSLARRGPCDPRIRGPVPRRGGRRREAGALAGDRGSSMKTLINIFRELAGLFIDDGLFALAISVVVVLAAIVAAIAQAVPIAAGFVLLVGCLGVLLGNVTSTGTF